MGKLWEFLNGKKTAIGAAAGAIALWALQKGYIDQTDLTLTATLISIWTGGAIVHKLMKGGK